VAAEARASAAGLRLADGGRIRQVSRLAGWHQPIG
jgi:hypothetical protein